MKKLIKSIINIKLRRFLLMMLIVITILGLPIDRFQAGYCQNAENIIGINGDTIDLNKITPPDQQQSNRDYWLNNTPFSLNQSIDNHVVNINLFSIDTSQFPSIMVEVKVKDRNNAAIGGLTEINFSLSEDGAIVGKQLIPVQNSANMAISLIIDRSGSMNGTFLDKAKVAAKNLIDTIGPGDSVELIACSDGVSVLQPFTSDKTVLKQVIDSIVAAGQTSLYDGILQSVTGAAHETGIKAVIVLTDGQDNMSASCRQDEQCLVDLIKPQAVPVYTIGIGSLANAAGLQKIASGTNGYYLFEQDESKIGQLYQDVARSLTESYRITYTSPKPHLDGTTRAVALAVISSSGSGLEQGTYKTDSKSLSIKGTQATINLSSSPQSGAIPVTLSTTITGPDPITRSNDRLMDPSNNKVSSKSAAALISANAASAGQWISGPAVKTVNQESALSAQSNLCFRSGADYISGNLISLTFTNGAAFSGQTVKLTAGGSIIAQGSPASNAIQYYLQLNSYAATGTQICLNATDDIFNTTSAVPGMNVDIKCSVVSAGGITLDGEMSYYTDKGNYLFLLSGTIPTYTLTTSKSGTGTGTITSSPSGINCGSDCSESYAGGTAITLTAAPESGSTFDGWSGGICTGTGTCTVTMDAAKTVAVTFSVSPTVSVTPSYEGISSAEYTGTINVVSSSASYSWTTVNNLSWVSITTGSSGTGSGTVNYRVSANTTGSARKGTMTIAGQQFTLRQAKSVLSDVPMGGTFGTYIYSIYTDGITQGCGDNNYCPSNKVTRGEMAAFIMRAKYGEDFTYTTTPYFSDVPTYHTFFKYVQKMKDTGITAVSGTYMVDSVVTREQMAAFIIRSLYSDYFIYTTTLLFTDVPESNTFFKYIQKMKDTSITAVTGNYTPTAEVTREQMAAFLTRAFLATDTTVPETTKVLDNGTINNLSATSVDGSVLTFSGATTQLDSLKSGDTIVTGISDVAPNGLLRKVSSVSKSGGNVVVTTTQATIEDTIQSGSISAIQSLTSSNVSSAVSLKQGVTFRKSQSINASALEGLYVEINDVVLYDHDGNLDTTNDQIRANGGISLNPSFNFSMTIDNFKLKQLTFTSTAVETAEIELTAKVSILEITKKVEIARYIFTPITLWAGAVPVVIVPIITVNVGLDGTVSMGITSSVTQQATLAAGLSYNNGDWSPISNLSNSFVFIPPTLSAGAEVKAYAGPQLSLLFYGVAGPYAEIKGYLELDADVLSTPWWELYGGLEADVGVRFEVLGRNITDYEYPNVIGYRKLIAQADTTPTTGTVSGSVKNALTGLPLNGVTIKVLTQDSEVATGNTNSSGTYSLSVPIGSGYRILFSNTGYIAANYYDITIEANTTRYLEAVLQIDTSHSGSGNISGNVLNALTGEGISGLTVALRSGINVTAGTIIATSTTGNSGAYSFLSIVAGNYTAQVSSSGYNTAYSSLISIGGTTTANQNLTVTPILSSGETRIILTWGSSPSDLDSHLTGPLSDGTRFHMYYPLAEPNGGSTWPDYVKLDLDDTSSYGPETTTIYQQISGVYRFSVHDYSNQFSSSSTALSSSGAQVRVYRGSSLVANFNVPSSQGGTLWTVFEMSNSTITPINTMSYQSDSLIIQSVYIRNLTQTDLGLLRNLPRKRY